MSGCMSRNTDFLVAVKVGLSAERAGYKALQAVGVSKAGRRRSKAATRFSIILVKAETFRPELNY